MTEQPVECPSCSRDVEALLNGVCPLCHVAENHTVDQFVEAKATVSKYRLQEIHADKP